MFLLLYDISISMECSAALMELAALMEKICSISIFYLNDEFIVVYFIKGALSNNRKTDSVCIGQHWYTRRVIDYRLLKRNKRTYIAVTWAQILLIRTNGCKTKHDV